ncbi:histidinol dehydrogenase [Portibacter lacus]|uniref:Histidinol dehydrogenase n=1 Tax=Portibacter lacus TaxID=1099794 RepID=A0AA37SP60_9BACT|nr:histidinol dehydrogenase [Portibacter lacus]GLR16311.1 histidinol dehydrogenase [Portibacter lacus]
MIVNPPKNEWSDLIQRPALNQQDLSSVISSVFKEVEENGDEALLKFTEQFDRVKLTSLELKASSPALDENLKVAIQLASNNIRKFHESQIHVPSKIETTPGVVCWQEARAIESVGLYIPGGTAPLFSTVLMLAIPAQIAGCKEIVLCTPPDENGGINPAILYAANVAGITKIFTIGGSQAIAALSLGTESVPKVQKIFGPGNQYVTAAKQFALTKGTAIDMPAGPSELLVIASENSNPAYVASDLLSQAEHGVDSQVICLARTEDKLAEIEKEIAIQIKQLPREKIAEKAIENSKFIVFMDDKDMIEFSNQYAPEHLIIADDDFEHYISKIENAGSVFLGNYCPESAGDYASGTNHTLPTAGFANMYSGVNLDSFIKKITFQQISKVGIKNLGNTIELMAGAEGLQAHKNAVTLRLKDL